LSSGIAELRGLTSVAPGPTSPLIPPISYIYSRLIYGYTENPGASLDSRFAAFAAIEGGATLGLSTIYTSNWDLEASSV